MDNESQVIREQMDHTRASLTDKLEELEQVVVGSVQGATNTVRETVEEVMHTVETVKESVHDTVESVRGTVNETVGSVRDTFDVQHQVDEHPWMMMAGATALGFIAGKMLAPSHNGNGNGHHYPYGYGHGCDNGQSHFHQYATASRPVEGTQTPREEHHPVKDRLNGLMEMLGEPMTQELNVLKGMALAAMLTMARDALTGSVPPQFQGLVSEGLNTVGKRMGAQPMAAPAPRMHQPGGHPQPGGQAQGTNYQQRGDANASSGMRATAGV